MVQLLRRYGSGVHLVWLVCVVVLLEGCGPRQAHVEMLPPPSFNPPAIAQAEAPRPIEPVRPAPTPTRVAPPAVASSGPREWAPRVKPNTWRWIVIHHSATPSGGAAAFDKMHRGKGWDELGYHFVIGNGSDTRDGLIEVGSRWPVQKWGAHTKTSDNQYNNFGIGICLVGNFENQRPTAAQIRSTARLVGYLQKAYGIPSDRVIGHGDAKPTDCPGRFLSLAEIRRQAAQQMVAMDGEGALSAEAEASAFDLLSEESRTAGHKELMQSVVD